MAKPGNPNFVKGNVFAKLGGPKTKTGKLVSTMNTIKPTTIANPESMVAKASGWDNSNISQSIRNYHSFVRWALDRKNPSNELSEIVKLEGMLEVMEVNLSKVLEKLEEGKTMTDKDRKDMFLMKDTLVDLHELKYGKKQLNINASYKDLRDVMFEE